ncbi:hypothetical protein B4N86_21195, partial [Acinetobacter baumannii]
NGDTLSIDGKNYQQAVPGQEGGVRGKMSYKNDIAPYLGFGFYRMHSCHEQQLHPPLQHQQQVKL